MKYMGSKARIAKEILPIILKDRKPGQWYVEPFAGGMNMIDKVENPRLANDSNRFLISMWGEILNNNWIPPKEISREEYNNIKRIVNQHKPTDDHIIGYVGFNCSYSGKWFGGYAGKTKTKNGTVRDYQLEAFKNIMKQKENLKGLQLKCVKYNELHIPDNSIVYCDPPYANTTGYKDNFNHNEFWQWVRETSKTNTVYVSEYNAPDDFKCVWQKEVKSSLSANGKIGGNKNSVEKLFRLKGNKND